MDIKLRFCLGTVFGLVLLAGIQIGMTDTYIVINTNESGAGSLRQAMLDANAHAGEDTIIFQIPYVDPGYDGDVGVWTIQPLSSLPGFVDDGTLMDGTTQADFIGTDTNPLGPEIAVDGINAQNSSGFGMEGSNNELKALAIYRFYYEPVWIDGSYNKVKGCYIGPDPTGTLRQESRSSGIYIGGGSYNEIGGVGEGEGNTISGNKYNGIYINAFAHENHIINNYIGINSAGDDTLGNGSTGIQIAGGSKRNTIGPGNVISGNHISGINFLSEETDSNSVIGNLIGTDPSGYLDWGNGSDGISISNGPDHTLVGGSLPEDRNIISGNHYWGIRISGEGSDSNRVTGNYIGTDITGTASISNGSSGIYICNESRYNVIGGEIEGEGNLLSGNEYGIVISGAGTEENRVIGNLIGTDAEGTQPLPNLYSGVAVRMEAKNNVIGPGNRIAYHAEYGVYVFDSGTIGNTITENSIHSNGLKGIENSWGGNNELPPPVITELGSVSGTAPPGAIVEIFSGPDTQGKDFEASVLADGTGNFYWEGTPSGFWITATATDSEGSTSEFSMGRHLGALEVTTTADAGVGSLRWAIESANNSLGPDNIVFNIPTGDAGFDGTVWMIQPVTYLPDISDGGTVIDGFSQALSQEETNEDGPEVILDGRLVAGWGSGFRLTSSENEINGLIVSGFVNHGIEISGLEARNNTIRGNYIGTNASADDTLGNGWGVLIWNGASNNTIGGVTALDRNVISGNYYGGINLDADSNTVVGNYIGTNRTGESRLSNIGCGINISYHRDNRIGGAFPEERNVISGNSSNGIDCYGEGAMCNVISGNYIGINAAGTDTLSNRKGIYIFGGPSHNSVGGDGPGEGNIIISAKSECLGISNADNNWVYGNAIGTDLAGIQDWGGSNYGLFISNGAEGNIIGGPLSGQRNIISNHGMSGIVLYNDDTRNNTIQGNCIGTDSSGTLKMGNGSNGIEISDGASSNLIGGSIEQEGNIICDNGQYGILIAGIETDSNVVSSNWIGTDRAKTLDMGNFYHGIALWGDTKYNQIGPENSINYNKIHGVYLYGALTNYNRITQNSISNNAGKGIYISSGANDSINAPVITGQSPFVGTAPENSSVEIFSDSTDQGRFYETTVTADGAGNWTWSGTPAGPQVTATATDAAGNTSEFSAALVVSVDRDKELVLPMSWHLSQNYPNPFNPVTTIEIGVREPCNVKLKIYNLLGREVVTLVDEFYQHGLYHVTFDASGLSSGIYFYRVEMGDFQAVMKMVLLE